LRRIKQNPTTQYQVRKENDLGNSNDEEDDDDNYYYYQGDQEGLSLLWQQKYTHEEALLHQKDDRQYLSSEWLSWLQSFCCCSS
jgi:hypothetical protein